MESEGRRKIKLMRKKAYEKVNWGSRCRWVQPSAVAEEEATKQAKPWKKCSFKKKETARPVEMSGRDDVQRLRSSKRLIGLFSCGAGDCPVSHSTPPHTAFRRAVVSHK